MHGKRNNPNPLCSTLRDCGNAKALRPSLFADHGSVVVRPGSSRPSRGSCCSWLRLSCWSCRSSSGATSARSRSSAFAAQLSHRLDRASAGPRNLGTRPSPFAAAAARWCAARQRSSEAPATEFSSVRVRRSPLAASAFQLKETDAIPRACARARAERARSLGGSTPTRATPTSDPRSPASSPPIDGLEVEVLNFDDSLRLRNETGETVVVEGYEGEPYVRISPDGTVEINQDSPTFYLNQDRFAEAEVPASADPEAASGLASRRRERPVHLARPPHPLHGRGARRRRSRTRRSGPRSSTTRSRSTVGDAAGRDRGNALLGRRGRGLPARRRSSPSASGRAGRRVAVRHRRRRRRGASSDDAEAKEAW